MPAIQMLYGAARAITKLRRRLRGPLLPTWDERLETTALLYRLCANALVSVPGTFSRRAFIDNAMAAIPVLRSDTTLERVDARGVPGTWFRRPDDDHARHLYYLHGGGFVFGSVRTHATWIAKLARACRATAFAVDYRLAPEHPFPAAVEDAVSGYRYLLDSGVNPARLIVAGESAGGCLTIATLLALRERGLPLPAAAMGFSSLFDFAPTAPSYRANERFDYLSRRGIKACARAYAPNASDRANALAAPLHGELGGLPPLLLQAGAAEVLVDDTRRLAARARACGVHVDLEIYDDMIHAWQLVAPWTDAARDATRAAAAFALAHTDVSAQAAG